MSDEHPNREPQIVHRTAQDSITLSDTVTVTRVAQAQALVAAAIGRAHDATARLEELDAEARGGRNRELAKQLASDVSQIRGQLETIAGLLDGIRTDAAGSGRSSIRLAAVFGGGGCLIGVVSIVVAVLVALGIIGPPT